MNLTAPACDVRAQVLVFYHSDIISQEKPLTLSLTEVILGERDRQEKWYRGKATSMGLPISAQSNTIGRFTFEKIATRSQAPMNTNRVNNERFTESRILVGAYGVHGTIYKSSMHPKILPYVVFHGIRELTYMDFRADFAAKKQSPAISMSYDGRMLYAEHPRRSEVTY